MNHGAVSARHYATQRPVRVQWNDGLITGVETAPNEDAADWWIAPAVLDVQVNGYAGIDFQQDPLTVADLLRAARGLRAAGCSRFLLTLITDEWPKLISRLRHLRTLRSQSSELRAAIAGWHIEGPFLSPVPGYHGAHDPNVMIDPSSDHLRELRALTEADPLLLTLAPERTGSVEAIACGVSLGFKVSLGHTNAPAAILRQAAQAGATGFTHLGNACPKELDRYDNILWRAFEMPPVTVGLIPDKIHVSPALFRLVHRVVGKDSIYYTTDAMSAAGAPPGLYTIGKMPIEVGADQVVRQPGRTNLAGSALRPIDGVFRAAQMLNQPWQEVWDGFAVRPAKFMGLKAGLLIGAPADFCLLKTNEAGQFVELRVQTPND